MSNTSSMQCAERRGVRRRRVAILHDASVEARNVRQVLVLHGFAVVDIFPNADVDHVRAIAKAFDLVVVPVDSRRETTIARLADLCSGEAASRVVAVAHAPDAASCLEAVRAAGAAALLTSSATASHIEFRLNQIVDLFPERRRCERVPVLLPVDLVTADGYESCEYAVSLSVGGAGLASSRALEPNSEVVLRLELPLAGRSAPVELGARVIHCVEEAEALPPFRIGLCFPSPSAEAVRHLEATIDAAR